MTQVVFNVLIAMKELFRIDCIQSENVLVWKCVRVFFSYGVQKHSCAYEKRKCAHYDDKCAPVIFYQVQLVCARDDHSLTFDLWLLTRVIFALIISSKYLVRLEWLLGIYHGSLEKIDPSIGCGIAVVFDGDSEDDSLVLIVDFFADRDKVSVKGLAAIFLSFKRNRGSLINGGFEFEFAGTALDFQKDEIRESFGLVLRETYFEADLVVVDLIGFEVEVSIILIDDCLLIVLGDLNGLGLALGADEARGTLACDVFVVGRACSAIKTLAGLAFPVGLDLFEAVGEDCKWKSGKNEKWER